MKSDRLNKATTAFRTELLNIVTDELTKAGGEMQVNIELPCDNEESDCLRLTVESVYLKGNEPFCRMCDSAFTKLEDELSLYSCDEIIKIINAMRRNREQAFETLRLMSFAECIKMWNDSACDHYCRLGEIHAMSYETWWNHLAKELGGWQFAHVVMDSLDTFHDTDKWFFYDESNECLVSFSTKAELIETIGEDFFIEELTNR